MSRRSLISPEENLIRSQRRGVPNVRMWSEQETPPRVAWDGYEEEPVFAPGGTPPDLVWAGVGQHDGSDTITAGAFPADMTHAIVLVGASNRNGMTPPDGWTVLAAGGPFGATNAWGGGIHQWAVLHTSDPAAGRTFTFPNVAAAPVGNAQPHVAIASTYYTGGAGGSWQAIEGAHGINTSQTEATDASGAAAWAQMLLVTSAHLWNSPGGFDALQGGLASAIYPKRSGSPHPTSTAPIPGGTLVDWTGLGALGAANALTFAMRWFP